jgi:hypothetical protein
MNFLQSTKAIRRIKTNQAALEFVTIASHHTVFVDE